MATPTYLDDIVAAHRLAAASSAAHAGRLWDEASRAPVTRSFAGALRDAPGVAVIAEFKRRSPSKGALVDASPDGGGEASAPSSDPAAVATAYEAGGAACLSVLTDAAFFGGSARDLSLAREATGLPVLRKDFTVCRADVAEGRCMGADAVLLIAAVLGDDELEELADAARLLGLDALFEVHDEAELERVLEVGATLVGVNQRDLVTFAVDPGRAVRVAQAIPDSVVAVAESGISGPDDVRRLVDAGYRAVLVGEHLMRAGDRRGAVAALVAAGGGPGHGASGARADRAGTT